MIVKPTVDNLAQAARKAGKKGPPPVHLWHPDFQHDVDIRIARDGTWFHEGSPINRAGLVTLFSSILRRDGDDYFLVTPAEKARITVDDAPFVVLDFETEGKGRDQVITFFTNVEDAATAGPDHPIRLARDPDSGEPAPYVTIRADLEALIDRKSFYRLIELGVQEQHQGENWFGLWSGGQFFPLIRAAELV